MSVAIDVVGSVGVVEKELKCDFLKIKILRAEIFFVVVFVFIAFFRQLSRLKKLKKKVYTGG